MLLSELDELAIRQAEEEAKRIESDTDAKSSKSKRSISSSAEYNSKLNWFLYL